MNSVDAILENAREHLYDMRKRKGNTVRLYDEDLKWYAWPQTWSNSTGGHGSAGGQGFSTSQTITVIDDVFGGAVVYHGSKLAKKIFNPNQLFWDRVKDGVFPAAYEDWSIFERSPTYIEEEDK